MEFRGIVVPLVTPFNEDYSIDFEALKWLLERLGEAGVHAVFSSSTTGEFPHLTLEEMRELNEFVAREAPKQVRVLAGVTANCSEHAVMLARHARDSGADAVVSATPYYFKHSREGLKNYFSALAERAEIPLILYTIPSTTGVLLPVDLVRELALEHSNIVGIKATIDSVWYIAKLVQEVKSVRKDFTVLTGNAYLTLPTLEAGGDGAVAALANIYPYTLVELYEAWTRGDYGRAIELHARVLRLSRLYELHNHVGATIKALLSMSGRPVKPVVRPPLGLPEPRIVEEFARDNPPEI